MNELNCPICSIRMKNYAGFIYNKFECPKNMMHCQSFYNHRKNIMIATHIYVDDYYILYSCEFKIQETDIENLKNSKQMIFKYDVFGIENNFKELTKDKMLNRINNLIAFQ